MKMKVKSGGVEPQLPPEPVPTIHKGTVVMSLICATEVRRNGKVIRRNGKPVNEEEEQS
jgi:hypothetical protein